MIDCGVGEESGSTIRQLKSLYLKEFYLDGNILSLLDIGALEHMKTLKKLSLNNCGIGEKNQPKFIKELGILRLEYLNLSGNRLGSDDLTTLNQIHTLKNLILNNCNLRKCIEFSDMIGLEKLKLSNIKICYEDLEEISAIKGLETLRIMVFKIPECEQEKFDILVDNSEM